MGNCCLKGSRSSTMVWAETGDEDDQWVYYSDPNLQQKQSLLDDAGIDNRSSHSSHSVFENENRDSNCKNREVKITLSKRKMEELLGKMEDVDNIPANQILERLINSSVRFEIGKSDDFDDDDDHHQQPWKPNLQSIPEEN